MEYSGIDELRNIYFEKSKEAKRGKKLLDSLLKKADKKKLAHLLRHHYEEDITDDETWDRDDVDFFFDYFSILALAIITGFVSVDEIKEHSVFAEIKTYLDEPFIKKYYSKHYPILLPQLLLEIVVNGLNLPYKEIDTQNQKYFQQFHQLMLTIDNDDVYQFLWFLDGGENDGYDIDDLERILLSPAKYMRVINGRPSALQESVLGFLKYLVFIEQFYALLQKIDNDFVKSGFWHFHGYWFQKTRKSLNSAIKVFFSGLNDFTIKKNEAEKAKIIKELSSSSAHFLSVTKQISSSIYQKPLESILKEDSPIQSIRVISLSSSKSKIPKSLPVAGIELRLLPPMIKDNNTPGFSPFFGFSKLYSVIIVISDANNQLTAGIDIQGFPRIGKNQNLPINKTIFYWRKENEEDKSPTQLYALCSIVKTSAPLRSIDDVIAGLRDDSNYNRIMTYLSIISNHVYVNEVKNMVSELGGVVVKYLGKIDRPLATVNNSYTVANGALNKTGNKNFKYSTKKVEFEFQLMVYDVEATERVIMDQATLLQSDNSEQNVIVDLTKLPYR